MAAMRRIGVARAATDTRRVGRQDLTAKYYRLSVLLGRRPSGHVRFGVVWVVGGFFTVLVDLVDGVVPVPFFFARFALM